MYNFQLNPDNFNPKVFYVSNEEYDINTALPLHFHAFPVIMFISRVKGNCSFNIDGRIYPVKSGSVLMINPGVYHYKIMEKSDAVEELHVAFEDINLRGYPPNCLVHPDTHILAELGEFSGEFEQCWSELKEEQSKNLPYSEIIRKAMAMKLIILALRCCYSKAAGEEDEGISLRKTGKKGIVNELRSILCENYSQSSISITSIAGSIYLSPEYLSRLFKSEFGESPMSYLIKLRLEKAKELLVEKPEYSVVDVAKSVGYDDVYYFSKLFKKYCGVSPSHYRNSGRPEEIGD